MREINVSIETGEDFLYVMVWQGTRSPHRPGGMRILGKFYVERVDHAGSKSVPAVLELLGREFVRRYGVEDNQDPLF